MEYRKHFLIESFHIFVFFRFISRTFVSHPHVWFSNVFSSACRLCSSIMNDYDVEKKIIEMI